MPIEKENKFKRSISSLILMLLQKNVHKAIILFPSLNLLKEALMMLLNT